MHSSARAVAPRSFPLPSPVLLLFLSLPGCPGTVFKGHKAVGRTTLVDYGLGASGAGLCDLAAEGGARDDGVATRPNCQSGCKPLFDDLVVAGRGVFGGRGGRERHSGVADVDDREDVRRRNLVI